MRTRADLLRLGFNQTIGHALGAASRVLGTCLSQPTRVQVTVFAGCNLRCRHCNSHQKSQPRNAMTPAEWEGCIDRLANWLGPFNLNVGGAGEPLLLGVCCIRLVAYAARQGARVQLSTNGTLLTDRIIDGLVEAGLASLTVSLDGVDARTHDFVRGVAGTHEQVVQNIRRANARRGRMILSVQAVVIEQNLGELEQLARWVENEQLSKLNLQALQPTSASPFRPDWHLASPLFPRAPRKVAHTLARLRNLRDRGLPIDVSDYEFEALTQYYYRPDHAPIPHCPVGYKNMNISEMGVATVCDEIRPLGNVRVASPKDLWWSPAAAQARAEVAKCRRSCSLLNCNIERPFGTKARRLLRELVMSGR